MPSPETPVTGIISNIQHMTVHDGPGVRTEVFFKGCPLRCLWCSNPEGLSPQPEVGVFGSDCIGLDVCGACLKACPAGALLAAENQIVGIDRETCRKCLACAHACPNNTLVVYGKHMTVDQVMKDILKDRSIYMRTGGGVTLSGGDCLYQPQFVLELLKACRQAHIHTCVESEVVCSTATLDAILPYTDLFITDIKHMDPYQHRAYTGHSNVQILKNIEYLAVKSAPLVIRLPIIPGCNDTPENIRATAEFLTRVLRGNLIQVQLIPYRPLGIEKYRALGMDYPMADREAVKPGDYLENIRVLAERFQEYGIPAQAGTTVKPNND